MRTLYRGGPVYTPVADDADALLVDGDRIAWVGRRGDAPAADRVVDLDGGAVTPAFVDAHLHATDTGLALGQLSLAPAGSARQLLDLVAAHADGLDPAATVFGLGWDESRWSNPQLPSAQQLERASGGRPVYLSRVDAHSALISAGVIAATAGIEAQPGFHPSGWVTAGANELVRRSVLDRLGAADRRRAQLAALRHAASTGIAAVTECAGPVISSEDDLTGLLAIARDGGVPLVSAYWGELMAVDKARQLGALAPAGDLFADGAFGSRTARLREDYRDGSGRGAAYLSREQVRAHVVACALAGVQAGFHAIGDGALDAVIGGFGDAAAVVGPERLRAGRHRVEHAELLDAHGIAAMAGLGLVASVQPMFDRLWGGPDGMYATRLGTERALACNPLAALAAAGVPLAFGSDAPVTDLGPAAAVMAATGHHRVASRLDLATAFAAHTRGGWYAHGRDDAGVLAPGSLACFAVWDAPVGWVGELLWPAGHGRRLGGYAIDREAVCRRTVAAGEEVFVAP